MKLKQTQICRVLEALGLKPENNDNKAGGFYVDKLLKDRIASGRIFKTKRGEYDFPKVKP